jgi:hypothetical protein
LWDKKFDFGLVSFVSLNAVEKPFGKITMVHLKKKKIDHFELSTE